MNTDRKIGAVIFWAVGVVLLLFGIKSAWNQAAAMLKDMCWEQAAWCLGAVFIGFALNAFEASKKPGITTRAWPLYAKTYLPFLIVAGYFVYLAVDAYTVDRPKYFYVLALLVGLVMGYDVDRVINRPLKFLRDSAANTTGP